MLQHARLALDAGSGDHRRLLRRGQSSICSGWQRAPGARRRMCAGPARSGGHRIQARRHDVQRHGAVARRTRREAVRRCGCEGEAHDQAAEARKRRSSRSTWRGVSSGGRDLRGICFPRRPGPDACRTPVRRTQCGRSAGRSKHISDIRRPDLRAGSFSRQSQILAGDRPRAPSSAHQRSAHCSLLELDAAATFGDVVAHRQPAHNRDWTQPSAVNSAAALVGVARFDGLADTRSTARRICALLSRHARP